MTDTTSTTTHITRVATTFVPVADQDAAIAFFTDKLGFEVRSDIRFGERDRWVEVAPPGGECNLALMPPMQGAPGDLQSGPSFATEDIEADHRELQARGVAVDELKRIGDPVPPMFFFRDVDGNRFLVVQREDA